MPKGIFLFAVLCGFATHAAASIQEKTGHRIEPLYHPAVRASTTETWSCTKDRHWCANVDSDGRLHPKSSGNPAATTSPAATWSDADSSDVAFRLWPKAVRLADGSVMFGVLREVSTFYSGGAASATELQLFHVHEGHQPRPILRVPVAGNASIRACFSEQDTEKRADACTDEYTFTGDLALDPNTREGPPVFQFKALATSFPGHVSRSEDSLAAPPLQTKDLITVTDPACSYQRTFRVESAADQYQPDAPLPSCDDYTSP